MTGRALVTLALAAPACPAGPPDCPPKVTYRLEYLPRDVPVPQLKLHPVTTPGVRAELELDKHTRAVPRTELVLKPREIVKEVTVCTYKPVLDTDPVTGCAVTKLVPVTEVKRLTETVYDLVPEVRTDEVTTYGLKTAVKPETVTRYEVRPETEVWRERVPVLVPSYETHRVVPPACPR